MKVNKIVWKNPAGDMPLVSWEVGAQRLTVHAFEINAEQTNQLLNALKEALNLLTEAGEKLALLRPAQRRD